MKTTKLQNFLKLHLEANALVVTAPDLCELISFNQFLTVGKYKIFLEKMNDEASFIHLKALMKSNGDVKNYLAYLQKMFSNSLNEFYDYEGYLLHKRMTIKDCHELDINFDDLSSDVKSKISMFISLQNSSLTCFLSTLNSSEYKYQVSNLKWTATTIDFIELANALFEGHFVRAKTGPITKKAFMKLLACLFNVKLGSWEITLNKAMSRENPAKFTDKLKSTISKYNEGLINI